MRREYLIGAIFLVFAFVIIYLQFRGDSTEGADIIGRMIASPAQSATTLTGLIIVFILVLLTFSGNKVAFPTFKEEV